MYTNPEGTPLSIEEIGNQYGRSSELFEGAVKHLSTETYRAHGLLVRVKDPEGGTQELPELDATQARNRLLALFKERHVVTAASAVHKGGVTQRELYRELYPDGPGAKQMPANAVEEAAYRAMSRWAWNQVSSVLRDLLEQDGQTYVLCETKVRRTGKQPGEEAGMKPVRFISDSGPVIMRFAIGHLGAELAKVGDKVEKLAARVRGLHPELALKIASELEAYVDQMRAALPSANPRLVRQLMAEDSHAGADGAVAA
jgi:hypothetical protein